MGLDKMIISSAVIPDVGRSMSDSMPVCEYSRGVCRIHKIRGIRNIIKTKSWKKKKYGFGWVTTTRIEYSCVVPELDTAPDNTSSAVNCHSPGRGLVIIENRNINTTSSAGLVGGTGFTDRISRNDS